MILHAYIARRFLFTFLAVLTILSLIYVLLDMVEHIRRFDLAVLGLVEIVRLTLLKMPGSIYQIMPLIVILAALFLFTAMARSSELVVTRAAGRSALLTLVAPSLTVLVIGFLVLAVLNPLAAATTKEYQRRVAQYGAGPQSILSISSEGLWLRQGDANGQTVIRAAAAELTRDGGFTLRDVTFLAYAVDGTPQQRLNAASARLDNGRWALRQAKIWHLTDYANPEKEAVEAKVYFVATTLTQEELNNSLNAPARVPIWDLPRYIDRLEQAGFSPRRHQVLFQTELALPLFLLAMLLIGAAFTMRPARLGQTGIMVLTALLSGFGIYFIRNFAQILGENGQIPVLVSAWIPPVAAIMLALGVILNLEDG